MFRDLFRHSMIYGVASVLRDATGFFLLPLYTAYLTVSEYGIFELFIVSIAVLFRLVQLAFGSAFFKYYNYQEDDGASVQNSSLISSSFYFLLIFAVLALLLLYPFKQEISYFLLEDAHYQHFIALVLLIVFLQIIPVIPMAYLRAQNRSVLFSVLSLIQFVILVGCSLVFVIVFRQKIGGLLNARAIAAGVAAVLFLWVIKKHLTARFSPAVVKEMLSYSLFLVPVSFGNMVLMMSNRYFILLFGDAEQLGLFSLGNKIAAIVLIAVTAFQQAWPSIMFRIKDLPDAKSHYQAIFTYYILAFSTLVLLVTLFSREIILIFANEAYLAALPVIPILSTSYFLYGLFYAGIVGITIFKKTYYQTIATLISATVNVVLNFWLTPVYGIMGTAVAFLCAFAVLLLSAIYFSQRIYYLQMEWGRIARIAAGFVAVLAVNQAFFQDAGLLNILLKSIMLFILLPVWLYWSGFFSAKEKQHIHRQWMVLKQFLFR